MNLKYLLFICVHVFHSFCSYKTVITGNADSLCGKQEEKNKKHQTVKVKKQQQFQIYPHIYMYIYLFLLCMSIHECMYVCIRV